MSAFLADLHAVVTAAVTHPAGVLLDDAGNPVLDDNGEPIFKETPE